MPLISKKELEHLAELARIELHAHNEEKLLKDLEKILGHFEELKEVNTENVTPATGGTDLKNILREDEEKAERLGPDEVVDAFPDSQDGYLKVPPVFE